MFNLRSEITRKLLNYYFLNPQKKEYLNELARVIDVDSGNLDRKIKELEKEGIFVSSKEGNQKYYSLNKNYPFLKELKKVFTSKYGLKNEIAAILSRIKGIKEAWFFGSFAKDSLQQESDIDLLIVGSHHPREVKSRIPDFQNRYGREFNIIDMTEEEMEEKKAQKDPFIEHLFSERTVKII